MEAAKELSVDWMEKGSVPLALAMFIHYGT